MPQSDYASGLKLWVEDWKARYAPSAAFSAYRFSANTNSDNQNEQDDQTRAYNNMPPRKKQPGLVLFSFRNPKLRLICSICAS